jgi:hypothetical protein
MTIAMDAHSCSQLTFVSPEGTALADSSIHGVAVCDRNKKQPTILDRWAATKKLRFQLRSGATANWERGISFRCKRIAALRFDKEKSCQLQIIRRCRSRLHAEIWVVR